MTRIRNVRNTTKFKRSIKAISPVIATLLMIAIAVVASLVVYAWVTGYMGNTTTKAGKAIALPSFAVDDSGNMVVYVQNVGQGDVEVRSVYINDELRPTTATQIKQGETKALTIPHPDGTGNEFVSTERYNIKVTTFDGTFMTTTGKPGSGGTTNPSTQSVVVTSFAITAPAESTDGTVTTSSSFTVKAMIHVSSGSVSVSATPTFPSGYTGAAAVSHTVGTTDVEFSWTITAPSSVSASAAVTLSAIATGYTSDTDNTFNVAAVAPTQSVVVTSFAITAPAESTDGTVTTSSSFTVKAMIHVSSGSVSVSATPTFPSGYTGAAAVSHTVGTTDVEFSWTITAPSSVSASAAVTLSAIATGYTSDTDNTFNVAAVAPTQSVVVTSFAITAPAESTDGTVTTSSSFTVKAMIHVSSGSVSVSATPTFPSGYTGAAAVSHTVGTTDVEFSWTITAPSSVSASAAVTLSAIATGYTSDTDNTFNVATVAQTRQNIFTDNFESNSWKSQWSQSDADISTAQAHSTTRSTRLTVDSSGNQGYIILQIATTGYTGIQLDYWRLFDRTGTSGDNFNIEWRAGTSGNWNSLEGLTSDMTSWGHSATFDLNGANNQAAIQIRFSLANCELYSNQGGPDYGYIDDITVTGLA